MAKIDMKQLSMPYVGDADDFVDRLFPVRTTTQLEDAADEINTLDKRVGRLVFNSTTGVPVWADGAGPTDTWSGADGTADHTPS